MMESKDIEKEIEDITSIFTYHRGFTIAQLLEIKDILRNKITQRELLHEQQLSECWDEAIEAVKGNHHLAFEYDGCTIEYHYDTIDKAKSTFITKITGQ